MRRFIIAGLAVVLAAVTATGCQRTIEVETGVRVVCPYGHTDSGDLKTVEVPAKLASAYRVRTEKRVCDRHQRLEALYGEAQAALAAGDLKTAKAKLSAIAQDERGFRKTAEQLAALDRGQTPQPDTGTAPTGGSTAATTTPKPGEGDTTAPIGALKGFVPDSLSGFTARPILTEPLSITREYDPTQGTDALLLTIVAEQFRTSAEAKRALETQMSGYTKSASTQTAGSRRVRFGSDGRRFVSVSFTDGAVLVVLELAARQGVDPVRLKGTVLRVAAALP